MFLRSAFALGCAFAVSAGGCGGSASQTPAQAPAPRELPDHALSGLAAQHIVLLPTYSVRIAPNLAWSSAVGRPVDVQRTLDADLLAALDERGLRKVWIFPEDLAQSYRRNASYSTDPYGLAEEPLRSSMLAVDQRLAEPLASQLRTLIALHEDARLVLAPVELRLEPAGTGGRGVLRLVLLDPRMSVPRWIGEVASDPAPAYGPVISASIASKLANLVTAR
jgi:hypothetical protein